MKRRPFSLALGLMVTFAGCGGPLQNEAAKTAKEHWKMTEIGGSMYLCVDGTVYELRNPTIEVSAGDLTEADKLNDVEWRGSVRLNAEAHRTFASSPADDDNAWSDWTSCGTEVNPATPYQSDEAKNRMDTVAIRKVKGNWEVVPQAFYLHGLEGPFRKVESSDLPK